MFTLAMKDLVKNFEWNHKGSNINGKFLSHLRFTNNVVFMSHDLKELEDILSQLSI